MALTATASGMREGRRHQRVLRAVDCRFTFPAGVYGEAAETRGQKFEDLREPSSSRVQLDDPGSMVWRCATAGSGTGCISRGLRGWRVQLLPASDAGPARRVVREEFQALGGAVRFGLGWWMGMNLGITGATSWQWCDVRYEKDTVRECAKPINTIREGPLSAFYLPRQALGFAPMNLDMTVGYSHRLGREIGALLDGMAASGVVGLPMYRGRFYQNEDFGLIGAIADRIQAGRYLWRAGRHRRGELAHWPRIHHRVVWHEAYESYLWDVPVAPLAQPQQRRPADAVAAASAASTRSTRPAQPARLPAAALHERQVRDGAVPLRLPRRQGVLQLALEWLPNCWMGPAACAAAGGHDLSPWATLLLPGASNENLSKVLRHKDIMHLAIRDGGIHDGRCGGDYYAPAGSPRPGGRGA